MKKVILSLAMFLGMLGVANAAPITVSTAAPAAAVSDAQCKYKLADARAGLKDLVVLGFVPQSKSKDGTKALGAMVYHNPKSADPASQDAYALVVIDSARQAELTLVVIYMGDKTNTVFERETLENGKKLGPCFTKKVEQRKAQ